MNISIFTYSVTRNAGGLFDAVKDLFTNSEFVGHSLNIISYKELSHNEDISQWKGIPIKLFKAGPLLYSRHAKNELINSEADILHMEALWRWPHLWMADWKQKKGSPIVCSPHGMLDPWIITNQGKLKRLVSNIFFQKGLEAVSCYHALCKKELEDIRVYGLKQPVAIIPNGINIPEGNVVFDKFDDFHHLLYLGRLHKKKGVDLLILALASIKRENPELLKDWKVDLVGWDDEKCKEGLENMVRVDGLEDIVIFHGGLWGDDKLRMYANADGYILPSHGEGLPMTVLEAWSWNVPVIMTPQCNIPEGFEANAAIRVEDNTESVAKGLQTFLAMSEEERKSVGERGRMLVEKDFTWDASARKMIKLYEWLLGKADKPDFVYE